MVQYMFWGIVKVGIQVGPMQDYDESYFWETAFDENKALDSAIEICSENRKIATHFKFHNIHRMGYVSQGYADQAS